MKTFKRYLLTILITTYSGVLFLRIFHYGFIYEKPSEIILGFVPTFFITLGLIAICSFFQWPLLTRFEKVIEKGKANPSALTQSDFDFCTKAYKNYDIIIIVAHVIGFLVGAGSTAIISSAKDLT